MSITAQSRATRSGSGCSPLRGQARELAILDATSQLLAETGYECVTMDAVAARAKASKATIYRKWPSKADLVVAAIVCHAEGQKEQPPDTGSIRGDLIEVVAEMSASFADSRGPSILVMAEAIRADDTLRDLMHTQIEQKTVRVGQLLSGRAASRGETVSLAAISAALRLAFSQLFTTALLNGSPPDDKARTSLVDTVLIPVVEASITRS